MCIFDRESKSRDMKQKLLTMETEQKKGFVLAFHAVNHVVNIFSNFFFDKKIH